ncbi:hypothetical protein RZS08_54110, partial [Arthrospira platensis SPKY1]|nr:hypothetical protein [Arthrospira platensis SPKY1]
LAGESTPIQRIDPIATTLPTLPATPPSSTAPPKAHPLLQDLPKAPQPDSSTIALLIGNRDYRFAPKADYAIQDIRLLKVYLETVLGILPEHILSVENATLS